MPPAFRSLDSSPIVKTLRLNHAAHFSVGTGAYPIAPTEDYSARPVGDFSGGPKFLLLRKTKNPASVSGRGVFGFVFFYATVSPRPSGPHTVARSISAGNFPFVRRYEPWCGRSTDRLRSHRKVVLACVFLESIARNIEGRLLPTVRTAITVNNLQAERFAVKRKIIFSWETSRRAGKHHDTV